MYGSRALYVVPHELIANADTVVALGEYSGTYKATGKSFQAPFVGATTADEQVLLSAADANAAVPQEDGEVYGAIFDLLWEQADALKKADDRPH